MTAQRWEMAAVVAKEGWREALRLDKDLRLLAIDDPDLRPGWDLIAEMAESATFSYAAFL